MPREMTKLMKGDAIKVRRALEGFEARHADEIVAGTVVRFACAFPDRRAAARKELIDGRVALVTVARFDLAQRQNAVRQALTLIDIEHCVSPHHGHDLYVAVAVLVLNVQSLDKKHSITVLPLAHVAA